MDNCQRKLSELWKNCKILQLSPTKLSEETVSAMKKQSAKIQTSDSCPLLQLSPLTDCGDASGTRTEEWEGKTDLHHNLLHRCNVYSVQFVNNYFPRCVGHLRGGIGFTMFLWNPRTWTSRPCTSTSWRRTALPYKLNPDQTVTCCVDAPYNNLLSDDPIN